jgi:hypothetical protein
MDPQLANLNFDPPRQPSPMRRGLLPALLVNAVFFACVALSLNWPGGDSARNTSPDTAARTEAPPDTRAMGAAPAMAPPPADTAAVQARTQPQPPLQVQPQPPAPQAQAVPPAAPPMGTNVPATAPVTAPAPARNQPAARTEAPRKAADNGAPLLRREAADNGPPVLRQATGVAVQPSFDCAKARSPAERTICSDPELAQLDRDTGRLHARAKAVARDPAAFRRENDREWKQRETECRDNKACLLAWYAHRRQQLQESVAQAR